MRAYFLAHAYLSPIQHGIQAQHCTADMFVYYNSRREHASNYQIEGEKTLREWAENHKTTIVLNGGNSAMLLEALHTFSEMRNLSDIDYIPYLAFHEDDDSMRGMMTCVGIVADDHMCELIQMYRDHRPSDPAILCEPTMVWYHKAAQLLASLRLA